jgi:hypothetical protein
MEGSVFVSIMESWGIVRKIANRGRFASAIMAFCLLTGLANAETGDAWYMVIGNSGQCRRFPDDFDPMPMQKKLQEAGGTLVDKQTGGSITDKSEKPGIIERVISNGKVTGGEVFVRGADACQKTAASMRDTHMMPFQQRATQKPP